LIKKFIKHVVILKGRHIWWSAYHNSDICLGGGILKTSLLGKSSKVAGFWRSASGLPWIFAENEEN